VRRSVGARSDQIISRDLKDILQANGVNFDAADSADVRKVCVRVCLCVCVSV
jgi:hypothetical protein